jgi:hypothetical protein
MKKAIALVPEHEQESYRGRMKDYEEGRPHRDV